MSGFSSRRRCPGPVSFICAALYIMVPDTAHPEPAVRTPDPDVNDVAVALRATPCQCDDCKALRGEFAGDLRAATDVVEQFDETVLFLCTRPTMRIFIEPKPNRSAIAQVASKPMRSSKCRASRR